MLKSKDLELHIGKFVKISVFKGSDLIVTSYGTISYDDKGWRVAGFLTVPHPSAVSYGMWPNDADEYWYSVYFLPIDTRILEGPEELHLIYDI